LQAIAGFGDEAGAFEAGPGAHAEDSVVDGAGGDETIEKRVNPTVKRDVGRAHLGGGAIGR
jgi:hypothetical protein